MEGGRTAETATGGSQYPRQAHSYLTLQLCFPFLSLSCLLVLLRAGNKARQHLPLGGSLNSEGTSCLVFVLVGRFGVLDYLIY